MAHAGGMGRAVVVAVLALSLAGCTGVGAPTPDSAPGPGVASPTASSRATGAAPAASPGAGSGAPQEGTVTGQYGRELRLIRRDPSATMACRTISAEERRWFGIRYPNDDPSTAAAVDVAEGWAVIGWFRRGERLGFVTDGGDADVGVNFQRVPADGTWRGTHTNAGIALEAGPEALDAAFACAGRQAGG